MSDTEKTPGDMIVSLEGIAREAYFAFKQCDRDDTLPYDQPAILVAAGCILVTLGASIKLTDLDEKRHNAVFHTGDTRDSHILSLRGCAQTDYEQAIFEARAFIRQYYTIEKPEKRS